MSNVSYSMGKNGLFTAKTKIEVPKSSMAPWHWPAPFSHAQGDRHNAVTFNQRQRAFIYGIYRNHITISNAVHTFIDHVLRNGIDLKVSVLGKTYELNDENDELTEYYTKVILPGIEKIFFEWVLFGYARIRVIQSTKKDELPFFVVLREGITEELMWWNKYDQRQYEIKYNVSHQGMDGQKVPGGMILIMNEPHDDGWLSSPVARATTQISTESRLWHYYIQASFTQSKQAYIFSPDAEKSSNALQRQVTLYDGQASLHGTSAARKKYTRNVSLEQYQAAMQASREAQKHGASAIDITLTTLLDPSRAQDDPNIPMHIKTAENKQPWTHSFTAPPGQKLQQPPKVNSPEKFLEVVNALQHNILRAIGLPPEMLSENSKQHAANVEQLQNELRNNIQKIQTKAKPLLRELFMKMFERTIHKKIFEHAKKLKKDDNVSYLKRQTSFIKVEIDFRFNPIMTAEQLFVYHERGVIGTETMQDYALAAAGMPKTAKLKNADKELAKRVELLAKAASAGKPEPQSKDGSSTTTTTTSGSDGKKSTVVKKTTTSSSPNNNNNNSSSKKRERSSSSASNSDQKNKKLKNK